MINRLQNIFNIKRITIGLVAALCFTLLPAQKIHAAPAAGSLDFIPADTGAYVSWLRNREQIEKLAKSNWWAKLKSMPAAQMGWGMFMQEWNKEGGPGQDVNKFLEAPENKELYELGLEMLSDEVFFYADESYGNFYKAYFDAINAMNSGLFEAIGNPDAGNRMIKKVAESLEKNSELINIPTVVIGFKIKNQKAAGNQLKRLVDLVKNKIEEGIEDSDFKKVPDFLILKKAKIAGNTFHYIEMSYDSIFSGDLPLTKRDRERFEEFEEKIKQYKKLHKKMKSLKVVVSFGIYKDYVLFSVAPSLKHIENFGKGDLLVNRKEAASLKKLADKKITNITYTSKRTLTNISGIQILDMYANMGKSALPLAGLNSTIEKRIIDDVDLLLKDIKSALPTPGAVFSVSYMTDRGYESLTHNWAKSNITDGSKKLTILDHVGGSPMLLIAGRTKGATQRYNTTVKWVKKFYGYFDDFAVPQMPGNAREEFNNAMVKIMPLVKRFDKINRELMLPATADGQHALIVDSTISSKQWHPMMPRFGKELGLPQIACVCGLSDSAKYTKAMEEYRLLINEAIRTTGKLVAESGGELPGFFRFQIPEPKKTATSGGSIYAFLLPKEFGLDKRIAINYGVSKSFAAGSFVPSQTAGLLKSQPLTVGGPLTNYDRPLASAFHLDLAALIDLSMPWVDGAMMLITDNSDQQKANQNNRFFVNQIGNGRGIGVETVPDMMIVNTVREVAELLKSIRGITSATHVQGDVTVTRTEIHLEDIKK